MFIGYRPAHFFYLLKLTRPDYQFRIRNLVHFSPLLLQLGLSILGVGDGLKASTVIGYAVSIDQLNLAAQLLAFISVSAYLYSSQNLVEQFYRRVKLNGNDRFRYELRWMQKLLSRFSWLWLLPYQHWTGSIFNSSNRHYYHYDNYGKLPGDQHCVDHPGEITSNRVTRYFTQRPQRSLRPPREIFFPAFFAVP